MNIIDVSWSIYNAFWKSVDIGWKILYAVAMIFSAILFITIVIRFWIAFPIYMTLFMLFCLIGAAIAAKEEAEEAKKIKDGEAP